MLAPAARVSHAAPGSILMASGPCSWPQFLQRGQPAAARPSEGSSTTGRGALKILGSMGSVAAGFVRKPLVPPKGCCAAGCRDSRRPGGNPPGGSHSASRSHAASGSRAASGSKAVSGSKAGPYHRSTPAAATMLVLGQDAVSAAAGPASRPRVCAASGGGAAYNHYDDGAGSWVRPLQDSFPIQT